MDDNRIEETPKPWLAGAGLAVAFIAAAKLAVHLYAGRHYGYFVDELYYLACARHLESGRYSDDSGTPELSGGQRWTIESG